MVAFPKILRSRRILLALLFLALAGGGAYAARSWLLGESFPRVPAGHVAILLRKSGRALPPGAVVAPRVRAGEEPYQGVQEEVLLPGWYPSGFGPWDWEWAYVPQTNIPPGHVGVLVRQFGEDLPDGQVLADENPNDEAAGILRRGPLRKTLGPGLHPVNLYAYDVRVFPAKTVESGQVGVVCQRYGAMPKDPKQFLSEPGERGVQKQGLLPGTYATNPFAEELRPVSRQSKKLDLGLEGRVKFPSSDGFDIALMGTVEWSLKDSEVPLVYVKFGDTAGAEQKLLLPAMRAKSRLQGSRKSAREFISGKTRQVFQDAFATDLRSAVEPEGIRVHAVLISGVVPPDEIAKPIRDREISLLEREQYQKQMNTERGRAELEHQNELQKRPQAIATAKVKNIEITTKAQRDQEVELIRVRSSVDVARLELQAAKAQADAILAAGSAEAEVAHLKGAAESEALRRRVEALGGGAAFARTTLLEKLAPRLTSVLVRPDGPLTGLLHELSKSSTVAAPGGPEARVAEVRP